MNRIADEIKRSVTMPELLARYGLSGGTRERIPCPIHQGKDKNFAVRDKYFKCYVCGAEGSVIDFVMQYRGLGFLEACWELNKEFDIGLEDDPAFAKLKKDAEHFERTNKNDVERVNRRLANERAEKRYYAALDKWVWLDKLKRENAPKDISEPFRSEYVYALHHIDEAEWELQQAQNALYDLKHKGR